MVQCNAKLAAVAVILGGVLGSLGWAIYFIRAHPVVFILGSDAAAGLYTRVAERAWLRQTQGTFFWDWHNYCAAHVTLQDASHGAPNALPPGAVLLVSSPDQGATARVWMLLEIAEAATGDPKVLAQTSVPAADMLPLSATWRDAQHAAELGIHIYATAGYSASMTASTDVSTQVNGPSFRVWMANLAASPVTFVLFAGMFLLFYRLWKGYLSPEAVSASAVTVLARREAWRVLTAAVSHADMWHIIMNSMTLYSIVVVEPWLSTPIYGCTTATVIVLVELVDALVRARLVSHPQYSAAGLRPHLGYSGVLFAWTTLVACLGPSYAPIPFVRTLQVPTIHIPLPFYVSFARLGTSLPVNVGPVILAVLIQFILPRASLIGHLAGVVVGYALLLGLPAVISPELLLAGCAAFAAYNLQVSIRVRLASAQSSGIRAVQGLLTPGPEDSPVTLWQLPVAKVGRRASVATGSVLPASQSAVPAELHRAFLCMAMMGTSVGSLALSSAWRWLIVAVLAICASAFTASVATVSAVLSSLATSGLCVTIAGCAWRSVDFGEMREQLAALQQPPQGSPSSGQVITSNALVLTPTPAETANGGEPASEEGEPLLEPAPASAPAQPAANTRTRPPQFNVPWHARLTLVLGGAVQRMTGGVPGEAARIVSSLHARQLCFAVAMGGVLLLAWQGGNLLLLGMVWRPVCASGVAEACASSGVAAMQATVTTAMTVNAIVDVVVAYGVCPVPEYIHGILAAYSTAGTAGAIGGAAAPSQPWRVSGGGGRTLR